MGVVEFRLPDVGEGLTEAEIVSWLVGPGDQVTVNQPIVAIETAKAVVELPCPVAGVVAALHVVPGSVVPVGTAIITIHPQGFALQTSDAAPVETGSGAVLVGYGTRSSTDNDNERRSIRRQTNSDATPGESQQSPGEPAPSAPSDLAAGVSERVRAKPLVRRLARTLDVDLTTVVPTGVHGDVTRADVLAGSPRLPHYGSTTTTTDQVVPVRGVQRAMADAMTRALTIPHALVWRDVDVTRSVDLVDSARRAAGPTSPRITVLTVAGMAVIAMARAFPALQSVWTDEGIRIREQVNLGIAVDSPRGLLVPSIKAANEMTFASFSRSLHSTIEAARAGTCTPADLTGGTITITNIGVLDIDGGAPIINPGESAIIAIGRIVLRPWVVDGHVTARSALTLSMSFDHRVIDGATAARALNVVAMYLEDPAGHLLLG